MGTKQVRLSEDVYARIESKKRDDETFSEAVDRLIGNVSLLDLVDEDKEYDPEREERRLAALERTARADSESTPEPPSNDS